MAASTMCGGVWKSGWPMPRLTMSRPSWASAVARARTAKAFSSPRRSKAAMVWSILLVQIGANCGAAFLGGCAASVNEGNLCVSDDLKNWQPRPRPERKPMEGRLVRLEPLDAAKHGDGLFAASSVPDALERF